MGFRDFQYFNNALLAKCGGFFTKKIPFSIGCSNQSSSQVGTFLMLLYPQNAPMRGEVYCRLGRLFRRVLFGVLAMDYQ